MNSENKNHLSILDETTLNCEVTHLKFVLIFAFLRCAESSRALLGSFIVFVLLDLA